MATAGRYRRRRLGRINGQRRRMNGGRRQGGGFHWAWLVAAMVFLTLGVVAAGAGASFAVYYRYASDLRPPDEQLATTGSLGSQIYDRNGVELFNFVDPLLGLRDPVPLSEISPWLIDATISTEDNSFYSNPGINVRGVVRAALENLTPFGPGFFEGSGGSSITQQLVKNVYIPEEERTVRSVGRKIKEIVMAVELKRRYDDDQILEWYLNQVYYGNFAYGAEAASWRYFGKPARELSLAEAAMLAGMPQAPGDYSPAIPENRPEAIRRQHAVLDLMVEHRYITERQAAEAKGEELNFEEGSFPIRAPHFVFYVRDTLIRMCEKGMLDLPEETDCSTVVTRGGLWVTTTLDIDLQERAQASIDEIITDVEYRTLGHNASAVIIEPATGQILAMVGSRDYFREDIDGQVNIALSEQSPGSSVKPYTYLTAFLHGWTPATVVRDEPMPNIKSATGEPIQNWNYQFKGPVTVRTALSESINIPAVRTVLAVGIENMIDTAHKMGITSLNDPSRYGPAVTIGGGEVTLLDHTYAYSVFANNGLMVGMPTVLDLPEGYRKLDPTPILRVENVAGKVLFDYETAAESLQVVPAPYAYLITDILSKSAIQWSGLTISRPAAAKTGTSEEFRDSLVMGYTPDRAVGVWMGNADNTSMAAQTFSSSGTGPIWRSLMEVAHEGIEPHDFVVPAGVVFLPCAGRMEAFVEGSGCSYVPPEATPTPAPSGTPGATATPTGSPSGTPVPSPAATPGAGATPAPSPAATPAATEPPTQPEPEEPPATAAPTPPPSSQE